jgi:hypothetical protein
MTRGERQVAEASELQLVSRADWHAAAPRGHRKLLEVWLDFHDGAYYAVVDSELPDGLGRVVCDAARLALDAWAVPS